MTVNDVRQIDDKLRKSVDGEHLQVPQKLAGTPAEVTAEVLTRLVISLDALKAATLDTAETGNLYAAFALHRVFLEHLLKAQAIYVKALFDLSDEYASKYLQLRIKEAYDYLRACEQGGIQLGDQPKTVLDKSIPEAAQLTEKEIRRLGEPFTYKTLISRVRELIPAPGSDLLLKLIPSYSELSGFVHGGPTAFEKLASLGDSEKCDAQLFQMGDVTVRMYYSAQRWLLTLATALDDGFQPYLTALDAALNEADNQSQGVKGLANGQVL